MTRLVRGDDPFDRGDPADDTRPASRGPLSDDLQGLADASRHIWESLAERLRFIGEVLDAETDGDIPRMQQGLGQIDTAITEALDLLGLPRGPIDELAPAWGKRYAGRKLPDCTLQINIDIMRRMSAFERGPDTTFRTWVHESIHGRQPYADGHRQEYDAWSGYEEGLAEALSRLVVRKHAGLDPIEPRDYHYFLPAYQTLSEAMKIEYEALIRALWTRPAGPVAREEPLDRHRVRRGLPPFAVALLDAKKQRAARRQDPAHLGERQWRVLLREMEQRGRAPDAAERLLLEREDAHVDLSQSAGGILTGLGQHPGRAVSADDAGALLGEPGEIGTLGKYQAERGAICASRFITPPRRPNGNIALT